jgi:Enoyl-(Acyl carrier protein) reductase
MTRQLAMEGRAHGIRANSISPGLIESNATRGQLKDPEWASYMLGKTLLGRLGRPEEVANVALFLASDENSYGCRSSVGTSLCAVAGEHQHVIPIAARPLALLIKRLEVDRRHHGQLAQLPGPEPLAGLAQDRRLGA